MHQFIPRRGFARGRLCRGVLDFQRIFKHWHGLYNCIHYADSNHKKDVKLEDHLYMLRLSGGMFLHGLQLDLDWPDLVAIEGACKGLNKTEIILQIGVRAFREIGDGVDELVKKLGEYEGIIHRVLLDKSMGKGIGMNAEFLLPFARAIRKSFPELAIGFAGGLSATSMNLLEPVLQEFPDCDQDAQGGMRPSGSYLDPIDMATCKAYLIESLKLRK